MQGQQGTATDLLRILTVARAVCLEISAHSAECCIATPAQHIDVALTSFSLVLVDCYLYVISALLSVQAFLPWSPVELVY